MLIGLRRDLAPGDSLALTLTFANGYTQTLRAPVVSFRDEGRR
jgi:copper(I)-binding protein